MAAAPATIANLCNIGRNLSGMIMVALEKMWGRGVRGEISNRELDRFLELVERICPDPLEHWRGQLLIAEVREEEWNALYAWALLIQIGRAHV